MDEQCWCFTVSSLCFLALHPALCDAFKHVRIGLFDGAFASNFTVRPYFFFVLACGNFDGLNETFWWLAQIGVNPLAFPGRSAVVIQSTTGMFIALFLVCVIFAITVYLSTVLVRYFTNNPKEQDNKYTPFFSMIALTVLPITAVYHGSHYYISFLVNSQYLVAALSDPFSTGANYLGLVDYQVTTGYLGDIPCAQNLADTSGSCCV